MRTSEEIVDAIVKHGNGFTKKIVSCEADGKKIDSADVRQQYVLCWETLPEEPSFCSQRQVHSANCTGDFNQQCLEILAALSISLKKGLYKDCWLPQFSSIDELDLKLAAMGV